MRNATWAIVPTIGSWAAASYPPEVIQAWILRKLYRDASEQIGEFRKVVITVPAYFDEVRRKATQDAGYIAGLEVLDIINEPTAAALAFGFQQGRLSFDSGDVEPTRVLVYDLGGGTFDVTVMEIGSGEFVTLATDGDVQSGRPRLGPAPGRPRRRASSSAATGSIPARIRTRSAGCCANARTRNGRYRRESGRSSRAKRGPRGSRRSQPQRIRAVDA